MDSNVELCDRPTTTPLASSETGAGGEGQSPLARSETEAVGAGQSSVARSGRGAGGEGGDPPYIAHETALIEPPATIGPRTRIGRFVHIKAGATIGADCDIGPSAIIAATAVLGDGVRIGANVVVDDGVVLEAGVFCGPGVVFATIVKPRSECLDACERQPIVVKRGASLGANATVVGGSTVGEFATVGAGAVVTGYVPRYAVVAGVPARKIGWLCRCTKTAFSFETRDVNLCRACGRWYRMQSLSGMYEFSPEEEKARDEERHRRHLASYFAAEPRPHGVR